MHTTRHAQCTHSHTVQCILNGLNWVESHSQSTNALSYWFVTYDCAIQNDIFKKIYVYFRMVGKAFPSQFTVPGMVWPPCYYCGYQNQFAQKGNSRYNRIPLFQNHKLTYNTVEAYIIKSYLCGFMARSRFARQSNWQNKRIGVNGRGGRKRKGWG